MTESLVSIIATVALAVSAFFAGYWRGRRVETERWAGIFAQLDEMLDAQEKRDV